MLKLGTKSTLFVHFWARILKNSCHIWNQHLWISVKVKFSEETEMAEFETKNAWFGYFWAGTWKQCCHIWNQHLQINLIAKFCEETKMSKFGTRNAGFGYFWLIRPYYCTFEVEF